MVSDNLSAQELIDVANSPKIRFKRPSRFRKLVNRASNRVGSTSNLINKTANYIGPKTPTPSSQQKFYKNRAKFSRGVQAVFPQTRIPGGQRQSSQGRVKSGRGRPVGSFKYFIPGRGAVDVFTWRKYVNAQKQAYRTQLQQQVAMQRIQQKYGQNPQQFQQDQLPQLPQQFNPYQQKPQFAGQSVMPVEPQPYKEISVLERTPINLSGITLQPMNEGYQEADLMTGEVKFKRRDGGFL